MSNFDQPPSSNIENPELTKKITFWLDMSQKTLSGEHSFANSYDNLRMLLSEMEGAGVSVDRSLITQTLERLPGAEMENIFKKAEGYLEDDDIALAKSWYSIVPQKLKYWESIGVFTGEEILALQERAENLRVKLGMEKE